MSPLALRRYRAERLLRRDFTTLRGSVLGAVRGRLHQRGAHLDTADLEECYAQAWQGLYATMLAGQEVLNPAGWLVQLTFRRAIEEARTTRGSSRAEDWERVLADDAPDPATQLDDRARLRQVFEAMRMRLRGRECEAASLCYLQGLSRNEAAARMGISEARMRKLMDGSGPGQPGVAAKVGELLNTIRAGRWCDEQTSLMRGLAFGVLDPAGERYRLALAHQRECPACRAYVASLRGLASVLPPLSLPIGLGAAAGAAGAAGAGGAVAGAGGWLLAGGSLSAKLAVGCVVALSVGAGCVALTVAPRAPSSPVRRAHRHATHQPPSATVAALLGRSASVAPAALAGPIVRPSGSAPARGSSAHASSPHASASSEPRARREFGPEGGLAPAGGTGSPPPSAVQASATRPPTAPAPAAAQTATAGSRSAREFGFQ